MVADFIDFEIPPSACPECGEVQEMSAPAPGNDDPTAAHKPGDYTVCFDCGAICEYGEKMKLVQLDEFEVLGEDFARLRFLQRKVRERKAMS